MWHRWLIVLLFLALAPLVQAAPTTPTSDFTDNGDGTVTHKITGLTWKRCAEGMTWTGSLCGGTAKTYTWSQANALNFAYLMTANGWRLPTIAELVTIVEVEKFKPAINATIFPNSPFGTFTFSWSFWSASAYAGYSANAWGVDFFNGYDFTHPKTYDYYVRLVRGGKSLDSSGSYTPTSDFSDNGDGSVTHKKTNLTWKRCAEGQSWNGTSCTGSATHYSYWSSANAQASGGWRLPSLNELQTIVEWSKSSPAINAAIFPNTPKPSIVNNSYFWSASTDASGLSVAWLVNLDTGSSYTLSIVPTLWDDYYVRLVRDGQSPTADCLFNWGEKTYPQYFSPAGGNSQTYDVYTFRQYTGNTYLTVSSKDNHLWVILAGNLTDVGPVTQWYATAGCK